MGTRHLTMITNDDDTGYLVAQYGQWDGYPEGQGLNIVNILNEYGIDSIRSGLKNCVIVDQEYVLSMWKKIGAHGDFATLDQSEQFFKKYPSLSRDTGSNIIKIIIDSVRTGEKVPIELDIDFAYNGLFCEYIYVLNMKTNQLEVYAGLWKKEMNESERFFGEQDEHGYAPPRIVAKFNINELDESFVDKTYKSIENLQL